MDEPLSTEIGAPPRARARLIVFVLIAVAVAAVLAFRQREENARFAQSRLERQTRQLTDGILASLRLYDFGLRGSRGTIVALGEKRVTREAFHAHWRSRDIEREFPGAHGFGFIRRVPAANEAAFLEAARGEGRPEFSIRRLGPNPGERWVIQYIEPSEPNREAIGLDIASEANRRNAAETAMRTGEAILTGPITLVQATGLRERSFLFLLPVYRPGMPMRTPEEREAATYGFTYAPLVIDEIVRGVPLQGIALAISDVTAGSRAAPFYVSAPAENATTNDLTYSLERPVYGRVWRIDVRAGRRFIADLRLLKGSDVFALGLLTALLAAGLLHALLVSYERKLQVLAQRARMSALVESSSDAIVGELLDGRIVTWNKAAELIFGWSAKEALGKTMGSLGVYAEREPDDSSKMGAVREGESVVPFDSVRRRRDGSSVDVSIAAAPLKSPSGRVVGVAKTIRDISDRKAFERQLQQFNTELERQVAERTTQLEAARHDLRTILDAMPAMVGYWDKNGLNRFANWAYHRWFGMDPGKMPGMHIRTLLGDALYEKNRPYMEAALRGEPQLFERTIPRPDGHGVWHSLAHYLPDVKDGEVRGFYVLVHDVTELTESRQKLAAALREKALERERLDNIIKGTHAGTWEWNVQTGEVRLNERWAEIIGRTLAELAPVTIETWRSHTHPEDLAHATALLEQHFAGQLDYYECELRMRHRDGHWVWVLDRGRVSTWTEDGKPEWMYGTHQDVTKSKEAQRRLAESEAAAQAASAAKSEFLANMSHEIRSPLNAIIGLAHLLEHTMLQPKQRGYLDSIHAASRALLAVIDDVLDLSKIEAEEMTIESVPFELSVLVDDVRAMMTPQAELKGLELRVRVDPAVPHALRGDVTRLRQILTNLLGNAIKFTERGYVELTVSCLERDDARVRLRCSVRDTGIGIAPEAIPRLFAPFTQADTSTTRRFGGTGLGLSIVKQLTTLMGGEVGVRSDPGVGSEFWVILPLDTCEGVEAAPPQERGARAELTSVVGLTRVHVLVVDDSEVNREVVRGILEREGADVSACANGRDALELLRQQPSTFDLVLMDVQMPLMDGNEATRRVRTELGLTTLPIVALTAGALTGERQRALEAGMNDFLTKPLEPRLLIRTVRRFAERARAKPQPRARERLVSDVAPAWPKVAGIDAQRAATRFQHDVERFMSLLAIFVREYGDWKWTELPPPEDTQTREEIAGHAHKLRGAAGVVAAVEIGELALRIETTLRGDTEDPSLGATLREVQAALRTLADSAGPLLEAWAQKSRSADESEPSLPEARREELERLRALLLAQDLSALERVEALSRPLRATLGEQTFEALRLAIRALDFKRAALLLPTPAAAPLAASARTRARK